MTKIKLISIIAILVFVLAAIPVFAGCGKVAAYADPATENILIAMNSEDYASFSKDFDNNMKSELSEDVFADFLSAVNGQVGNYIPDSKNLNGVNIENGLTTATYSIDFESMEDVALEVVFQKIDDKMMVVGLWFN
jgi:hypothetical protein